jgi:hypothetical protein
VVCASIIPQTNAPAQTPSAAKPATNSAKPNILVIFGDDIGQSNVSAYSHGVVGMAASFMVAARHMRLSRLTGESLIESLVTQYQTRMQEYARYSALELWYERTTFDRMLETAVTPERRRMLRKGMEKAASRTHESVLEKVAEFNSQTGSWTLRDMPPGMFHVHGANTLLEAGDDWVKLGNWQALIKDMFPQYVKTLSHDRRALLKHFTAQDLAFKVVGVGSVGTRCLVLLMIDELGKPMFLQIKEARPSVIEQYFNAERLDHAGERVVRGQRAMQAASDIFLGWATGPSGRHFYFRQLRDMKLSANIELFDIDVLEGYARLCGWILARAHAKASGEAIEISAYLGQGTQFAEALVAYSRDYADQVERDFDLFTQAARTGRIVARTDDDMAADFHV